MTVMTILQAKALASEGTFNKLVGEAESIAETISRGSKRDIAFSKIAIAYARRGQYEHIEFLLSKIDSPQMRVNTILDICNYSKIRAQNPSIAARILASANELIKLVGNAAVRDNILWRLAYRQALNGQSSEAHDTARHIGATILQDQAQYQIASAQSQIGDLDGAIGTAEAMRQGKWKDDAFAVIAGAVAKSGDINKAQEMAERSQSQKQTALYFMAQSRGEIEDFETGLALSRKISNPGQRAHSLRLMAEKAIKLNKPDIAREFLQEARASARDTQFPSRELTWIGSAQAKAGFISDAFETAADIELRPLRERSSMEGDGLLWVFREIVQSHHNAGKIEEARLAADLARRAWLNSGNKHESAALAMIRMASVVGDFDLAREIAETLPKRRQFIEKDAPSGLRALEIIAITHAKAGDYEKSLKTVAELIKIQNRDDAGDGTLWQIALEQMRRNDVGDSLTNIARIHDPFTQVIALTEVAALAKH